VKLKKLEYRAKVLTLMIVVQFENLKIEKIWIWQEIN